VRAGWLAVPPLALVLLAFAVPIGSMLADAWHPGALAFAASPYVRYIARVSAEQAAASVALAAAAAMPLAWLHHHRAVAGRRVQLALHAAPFVMPVFVVVFGLQDTLGARGWLHASTGWDLLGAVGPFGAVVLAHAYYNYGFLARLTEAILRSRPRNLEAAARTLGANPTAAFLRVGLPPMVPPLAAALLLAFLFCFGSFGTVLLLGQGHVLTFETEMFRNRTADPGEAAILGALELLANGLLLGAYVLLRRRTRLTAEVEAPLPRATPALSAVSWVATGLALLPLAAVLVDGFRAHGAWSLRPWSFLLSHPAGFDLPAALGLSLAYAAAGAVGAVLLTVCLAYGARSLPRLRRALEATAGLPVAGSGILLGLGLLAAYGDGGLLAPASLEGTVWIVVLAHVVLAFPFAARLLVPAFDAMDVRLGEAARSLGASPLAVAARVDWPALRPAVLASAGLAAALSLGDFGASALLMQPGTQGITVWIAQLDRPFDAVAHNGAVALAGVLCAVTLLIYLAVERAGLRRVVGRNA